MIPCGIIRAKEGTEVADRLDLSDIEFVPPRKRVGRVSGVFSALGAGFETQAADPLVLTYEGIPGDRHQGLTRKSNSREPWYPRGTEMRNEQQVSILSTEELRALARDMDIEQLRPEWIGGNIVLEGIPHLSLLPPRTLLLFEGGVSLRVDGDRGPCRVAGKAIADRHEGRDDLTFLFPKVARHRRGLVGWVEIPGEIRPGEMVTARIWEQCIYPDRG